MKPSETIRNEQDIMFNEILKAVNSFYDKTGLVPTIKIIPVEHKGFSGSCRTYPPTLSYPIIEITYDKIK